MLLFGGEKKKKRKKRRVTEGGLRWGGDDRERLGDRETGERSTILLLPVVHPHRIQTCTDII